MQIPLLLTAFVLGAGLIATPAPGLGQEQKLGEQVGLQGGYARNYCGVHYPSDVLASQRLAIAISKDVIASAQWKSFKEQLKPELQKLMVAPPAGLPLLTD